MDSTKRKDAATTTRESYGIKESEMTTRIVTDSNGRKHITNEPLLHPQQRTWEGLTEEEFVYFCSYVDHDTLSQIENVLRDKNELR